jgi:hypothetical protein
MNVGMVEIGRAVSRGGKHVENEGKSTRTQRESVINSKSI